MKKDFLKIILAGLVASFLLSLLFVAGFFNTWRLKFTDRLFFTREAGSEIVIIAIDNDSLQKIGRWPWDRKIHANLIEKIGQLQPAVIGYDVNFPEKSSEDSDALLAEAVKKAGNVILPKEADLSINKNKLKVNNLLLPIESLKSAAAGLGITNTPPDQDGVFRKLPVIIYNQEGQAEISFANLIANRYLAQSGKSIVQIPTDKNGKMIINFTGGPKNFSVISAADILSGNATSEQIKDKIILIGATAPDLHDEQLVPTSSGVLMSGVEIHANAVKTIISQNFLKPLKNFYQILIFLIVPMLLGLTICFGKIRLSAVFALISVFAYLVAAIILFDRGFVLDIFYFIVVVIFSYLSLVVMKYFFTAKEKKFIQNTFSRYVSQEIIDEITANPEKLKLGGQKKELTILFSDVRGFTTISEKLSPEDLVALLNNYLTAMTDTIMELSGVIDKYIGDAIMAFWGAPIDEGRHAEIACLASLEMIKKLKAKQPEWRKQYDVEVNIGIGLNTGEAVIGNMGSDKRFDYTIMGDSVNLASRLESLTKQYGVKILISQFTKIKAGEKFIYRFLDRVAVKGKKEAVEIYELVCVKDEISGEIKNYIEKFNQGTNLYFKRYFNEALEVFSELVKNNPDDLSSKIYLDRSREFIANPPADDWDGIYKFLTK